MGRTGGLDQTDDPPAVAPFSQLSVPQDAIGQ